MAEFIKLYEENPQEVKIRKIAQVLKNGGLIIYPTDTVYGIGCDLFNQRAIQRLCHLKGVKPDKLNFSFLCSDLSDLSLYAKAIPNHIFKLMKKVLPGPYTFILHSNSRVPKIVNAKKKQVGIRVPNNNIIKMLVQELGNPIISSSIKDDDEVLEYQTDPELIFEKFEKLVDVVIDGGFGHNTASTVVDCTSDEPEVVRYGLGEIDSYI